MNWHRLLAKIDEICNPLVEAAFFIAMVIAGFLGANLWFGIFALVTLLGSGLVARFWGMVQNKQDAG
jgi:hypothetical protein